MLRFLSLCMVLGFALQLPALELSEKVREEQAEYQVEIEEIVADAREDVQEARIKLLKSLEKELASVSKKGDLALAQAIQERIDELNKPQDGKDLFGNEVDTAAASKEQAEELAATITIKRAFLRKRGVRQRIEVTAAVQALVDAGQLKIIPAEQFADKMKGEVDFLAEIETAEAVKMVRAAWTDGVDLSTGKTY